MYLKMPEHLLNLKVFFLWIQSDRLYGAERFNKFLHFMGTIASLSCSQKVITGPHPHDDNTSFLSQKIPQFLFLPHLVHV